MASNSSGPLNPSDSYTLGSYVFTLQNVVSEDERIIQAHITGPEGSAAKGITVETSAKIESWSVEANETEATVYAIYGKRETTVREVNLSQVNSMSYSYLTSGSQYWPNIAVWADFPAKVSFNQQALNAQTPSPITLTYYAAKDIYIGDIDINGNSSTPDYGPVSTEFPPYDLYPQGHASKQHEYEALVARFSIDLHEADPEDWDEPGDTGESYTTLHLDITGALSGRHNDPLSDTSYSYLPTDKNTVKFYGCGGDGGHGGGGGGGAATIIVNRFGTDKASSKEIRAMAKRHGYGSGGGKGGKGGDGVILIYW